MTDTLHIVFDGPPSPEGPRFIEVETPSGRSINDGEWAEREDGRWQLVIGQPVKSAFAHELEQSAIAAMTAGQTMTDTTAGEGYSLKGEALEMITALEAEATHQGRGKPTDQPGFHKTLWSAAQRLRVADEAEWWNTIGAAALAAQPSAGAQGEARFAECHENGAHPNCHRCYRSEVPNMSCDDGSWFEMGAVSGGANEHGMFGWIEMIEHTADGEQVRHEYVRTDSPLYATPAQPDTGDVAALREAIARIIDPKAWAKFDRLKNGGYADHIAREQTIEWSASLRRSLAKADATLAALSKPSEDWRESPEANRPRR